MFERYSPVRLIFSTKTDPTASGAIAEPATVLTDAILSAQTLVYADRLRRGAAHTQTSAALWAVALAAASLAALAGALTHALHEDTASVPIRTLRRTAWKTVGLSTATASALMLAGSIYGAVGAGRRAPYLIMTAVKALIFATASVITGSFLFTILDYAASMLVVLTFQFRNWRTDTAAPWLSGGIAVSFLAAAIQRSGIRLHAQFNHNDLYHVVQMVAFHLLYEGARRQQDRKDGSQPPQSR